MKDLKLLKHELQNLINGAGSQRESDLIQTAKAFLGNNSQAGGSIEKTKLSRAEEEGALKKFATTGNLIVQRDSLGTYITEGAEQKV